MPGSAREREREQRNNFGTNDTYNNGVLVNRITANVRTKYEHCYDTFGYRDRANPFDNTRYDSTGLEYLNGTRDNSNPLYAGSGYHSWPVLGATDGGFGHLANPYSSSPNGSDFSSLVARSNPSAADVSPLGLVQDLVTFPKLLDDTLSFAKKGRKPIKARDTANVHLMTQFGWMPLVDDAKKLLNLQKRINKRVKEIEDMFRKGGQTRTRSFGEFHAQEKANRSFASSLAAGSASGFIIRETTVRRWGSVRWVPNASYFRSSDFDNLHTQITRAVEGLTYNELVAGAWDLVPWTWVTDWFADMGSFIRAHANTIPSHYEDCCIMTHSKTTSKVTITTKSPWLSGGEGTVVVETSKRHVGSPDFIPHLPFLSGDRLSVLQSLFIQRLNR
jgi:hypothetical protein